MKRPWAVILVAGVYIVMGVGGILQHFSEVTAQPSFQRDALLVELVSAIALLAGIFLLRGQNWARWLALGWIGFHVVLSFFHTRLELAMHVLIFGIVTVLLFRPASSRYFRGASAAELR